MTIATSVHEIQALILSYHPVVVVETVEEERLRGILLSVANQARLTMFEWSLAQGLNKATKERATNLTTAQPIDALRRIDNLIVDGLYLLKDFAPHLKDPAVARQFRETAERFTHSRSALVVTGTDCDIPAEIEPLILRYPLRMPGQAELREVVETLSLIHISEPTRPY